MKKYIRYSNNKYLVTENNWENVVSKTEFNLSDYSLENDQDNVYKAKLIYEIGKAKSMLILNELQKIRELLEKKGFPSPTSDGFGNAFEVFALSVIHNLDYDECITNHIVLGSNDGKTDAVYWTSNEVYLYQIKLNDLIETDLDIMRSNYGHFINTGDIPGQDVSDLKNFYIKNKLNISGVKKIEVCSVSKNGRNKKNRKPLDIYREYFEFQILPQEKNSLNLELYIPSVNEEDYPERRLNNMAYIKGLEYFFSWVREN